MLKEKLPQALAEGGRLHSEPFGELQGPGRWTDGVEVGVNPKRGGKWECVAQAQGGWGSVGGKSRRNVRSQWGPDCTGLDLAEGWPG